MPELPFPASPPTPLVGLTYANERKVDGIGAQLHCIFGLYAASRLTQVAYIHHPLRSLDDQRMSPNEVGPLAFMVERYNRRFFLPSDLDVPENHTSWNIEKLDLATIRDAKRCALQRNDFHLLYCKLPFPLMVQNPEAYRFVRQVVRFQRKTPLPLRVAIHVRRRFLAEKYRCRLLPNSYYIQTTLRIGKVLRQMGLPYISELYTDLSPEALPEATSNVIDVREMGNPEEFDLLPNLSKFVNTDPLETFESLATADILIPSHSSFSYVPAVLNDRGIVLYHPFWHRPMNDWLIVDDAGGFPEESFREKVGALVSSQGTG